MRNPINALEELVLKVAPRSYMIFAILNWIIALNLMGSSVNIYKYAFEQYSSAGANVVAVFTASIAAISIYFGRMIPLGIYAIFIEGLRPSAPIVAKGTAFPGAVMVTTLLGLYLHGEYLTVVFSNKAKIGIDANIELVGAPRWVGYAILGLFLVWFVTGSWARGQRMRLAQAELDASDCLEAASDLPSSEKQSDEGSTNRSVKDSILDRATRAMGRDINKYPMKGIDLVLHYVILIGVLAACGYEAHITYDLFMKFYKNPPADLKFREVLLCFLAASGVFFAGLGVVVLVIMIRRLRMSQQSHGHARV